MREFVSGPLSYRSIHKRVRDRKPSLGEGSWAVWGFRAEFFEKRHFFEWLRLEGSSKLQVSFAEYSLFYRALLQKRPIILRSLLTKATQYDMTSLSRTLMTWHSYENSVIWTGGFLPCWRRPKLCRVVEKLGWWNFSDQFQNSLKVFGDSILLPMSKIAPLHDICS